MRKEILLLLSIVYSLTCQAINIDGVYIDEYGNEIIISDYKFIYIEKQSPTHNTWKNDTLAVCKINKINNRIIEINSIDIYETLYQSIELSYIQTDSKDDSIKVIIDCPYKKNLNISISREDKIPYEYYHNSRYCNYVYIPKKAKELMLCISPDNVNLVHTTRGQSFGLQELAFNIYIDNKKGDVIIKIPILNDCFYEKYFITNEYVYIEEKIIHWKGNVYKKRE